MANELKEICDLLAGKSNYFGPLYQVTKAEKTEDGRWELVVQRIEERQETEVAENANK